MVSILRLQAETTNIMLHTGNILRVWRRIVDLNIITTVYINHVRVPVLAVDHPADGS